MNFRTTTILFGLLLAVLWVLGLMLAIRKPGLDDAFVMPRLANLNKDAINYVEVKKGDKSYLFIKDKDKGWLLKESPSDQEVRAEGRKVDDLVEELRTARHANAEVTDLTRDLKRWGLQPPKITVTLKDTSPSGLEAEFYIGEESGDKAFVYCSSSERKRDVLAVKRSSISSVFITDIDDFRVRRLLTGTDLTVKRIKLVENKDGKTTELALEEVGDNSWKFIAPKYGAAQFASMTAAPKGPPKLDKLDKLDKQTKQDQSIFSLINAVTGLRAERFEPINTTMRIDEKKALLRIELETSEGGKLPKKDKEKGKFTKEVLLIGDKLRKAKEDDPVQYYAQLLGDNSVVVVDGKLLEPVFAMLKDSKLLRSRDVAQFEIADVDAADVFKDAKDFVKLYLRDRQWLLFAPDITPRKASNSTVDGPGGLLAAIQGKNEIADSGFVDTDTEQKLKDVEAKFAKDKILATVSVWSESLEPEKEAKKDEKKDDKKDDKKDVKDKKDEKKDDKKDAKDGKKDDKKDEIVRPETKKDAKPLVTLTFVGLTTDKVLVKREAKDSDPVYFELAKADFDKIVPPEMALTFFDTSLTTFDFKDVNKLELVRRQDKEGEKFVLDKVAKKDEPKKDDVKKDEPKKVEPKKDDTKKDTAADTKKDTATDTKKDTATAKDDSKKETPKETKKDDKDDKKDDKKEPELYWKIMEPKDWGGKTEAETAEVDGVLQQLAGMKAERWVGNVKKGNPAERGLDNPSIMATVTSKVKEGDKETTKTFTLKIGNKSRRDSDAGGYYALVDGSDYIFVVSASVEKSLRDAEFRDRHVLKFDPAKVKELQCYITDTTGKVQFKPLFKRDKDKWAASNLDVVNPDLEAVDKLLKNLSDLKAVRYLNVKPPGSKDFKLDEKIPLKYEITMEDGKKYWVAVGAESEKGGPYYAMCSEMPNVVFLVPRFQFAAAMEGLPYFSKE
jgi:hypothetical protein